MKNKLNVLALTFNTARLDFGYVPPGDGICLDQLAAFLRRCWSRWFDRTCSRSGVGLGRVGRVDVHTGSFLAQGMGHYYQGAGIFSERQRSRIPSMQIP